MPYVAALLMVLGEREARYGHTDTVHLSHFVWQLENLALVPKAVVRASGTTYTIFMFGRPRMSPGTMQWFLALEAVNMPPFLVSPPNQLQHLHIQEKKTRS